MGKEIERKFLLNHAEWDKLPKPLGNHLRQGYISTNPHKTIRVRVADSKGWLTIKGISTGASRMEYEYEIPLQEARELLDHFSDQELEKIRYEVLYGEKIWEIDVFLGDNQGLIVGEIELSSEDEYFDLPIWIDREVTHEQKYFNSNLTQNPFKNWP